jgi:deoxyribonuclease-4
MRIGAHVSTSGAIPRAIDRAVQIGAECVQVFVGAPHRWAHLPYTDEDIEEFKRRATAHMIGPNVVHALYLVNLASPDSLLQSRSIESLIDQMRWTEALGALGLIVHIGSRVGRGSPEEALDRAVEGIGAVLQHARSAKFLIENTAGMGTSIGSSFAEIGEIIRRLDGDERLAVCLDTAHAFESGHDFSTPDGLEAVLDEFDRELGLDRLAAIHVNDSKTPLGSNVDRHENIGQGYLGEATLELFMRHPAVQHLPFFLEVPGFGRKGPDRENIDLVRRLAGLPAMHGQ